MGNDFERLIEHPGIHTKRTITTSQKKDVCLYGSLCTAVSVFSCFGFFFIRHCDRCYIILLLLSVIEFVRWVKCGCHNCFIMCNAFSTFTFWPFPLWRRRWHFPFIQFLYFIETLRIVGCRNHLGFCSYYSFTKKKLFGY